MARTYVPTLRKVIVYLCAYITRHRTTLEAALTATITNPTKLAIVMTCLAAIVDACAVLEEYFPDIP